MMRIFYLCLTALLFNIYCYGHTNDTTTSPNIYILGSVNDGAEERHCYWKNGEPIFLPDLLINHLPNIRGKSPKVIAVDKGDVYIAGTCKVGAGGQHYVYCFINKAGGGGWGIRGIAKVEEDSPVDNMDMAVFNDKVYITGQLWHCHPTKWATWVNWQQQSGGGPAITVHENVIYFVKRYGSNDCFEAYGQSITLEGPYSKASGITVKNDVVYVSGSSNGRPCYWIDGKKKDLIIPHDCDNAGAWDIAVSSDGTVHVIGGRHLSGDLSANSYPTYWIGSKLLDIKATGLKKICAFEDKVYVLGSCQKGAFKIPCYWIIERDSTGRLICTTNIIPGARTAIDMVVTKD